MKFVAVLTCNFKALGCSLSDFLLEVLTCLYAALDSVGTVTELIKATQAGEGK